MAVGLGVNSSGSQLLLRCSSFRSLRAGLASLSGSAKTGSPIPNSVLFHTGKYLPKLLVVDNTLRGVQTVLNLPPIFAPPSKL